MVKKIILGVVGVIAALVLLFVIIVAMQPSDFRVERSVSVNAPPAVVFDQVNNLRHWEAWSPWAKKDPSAVATFEGPEFGEGATFAWSGNEEIGVGRMTITESEPAQRVRLHLAFEEPFESESEAEFTFEPQGDQATLVTWAMTGESNFIGKAVCLFMDMDEMVGGDFEKGLASIKAIAEAQAGQADQAAPSPADETPTAQPEAVDEGAADPS